MRQGRSLAVGSVLCDKWRILRVLGAGGMATVYEATHRNGKRVAMKILHSELRTNEQARARFLREGYIANRVDHPNVPSVLDDGETSDCDAFLVMDLLHGETLETRNKAGRLSLHEVLRIALALLDVLAAAHEKGIVHRDIKPSNVFLSTDGAVKLLDFGIARIREVMPEQDCATLSRGEFALGTPSFMAPEQARGHWDEVDARTDIWSVGALMFALLTGRNVHQGQTIHELMILSATAPATPVASLRPELPADYARVVDRALSFHRELRWPDARAMHSAIRSLLQKAGLGELAASTESSSLLECTVASTTDQLSAVIEVPRLSRRSGFLSLAGAALLASASLAWLASTDAGHAVPAPTRAVTAKGSEHPRDAQPAPVTAPLPRTEVPRVFPPPINSSVLALGGVGAPRKSRPRSVAQNHMANLEESKGAKQVAPAASAPEPTLLTDAPGAPAADTWLERQK